MKNSGSINSILIIRLSALGDIIMSSPLIPALRHRFPDARLVWMVQPEGQDLVSRNADIDETIVLPRNAWKQLWAGLQWIELIKQIFSFVRCLRRSRFDLVIDAQGLLKSGVWAWLSGARNRVGLGSKEGSSFFMSRVIEKPKGDRRIGSEYRYLIKELGLDQSSPKMKIGLAPEDEEFAERFIKENNLENGYVAICPFTTRPQKHWFDKNWRIVIDRVGRELGLPVIILGGPGDKEAARVLIDAIDHSVANMTGKTRLRQAAALIKHAKLLIGVDTGLSHMGTAFEIPTIVLFGSTCPYLETDSDKTRVIYKNLECSPCRRKPTCNGDYTCMKLITAEEVIDTARELLPNA